jgi:putative membrane-bound dehydrogenase-like protein
MTTKASLAIAALWLLSSCGQREAGPLSPEEALESFRVADGFRIELFAAEPHVVDPVDLAFDENGGAYVAELGDNPEDPPEGADPLSRIKYLQDTDGDGVVDKHTVFADKLLAVEGIAPWMGGLIVTAAPDILYLKDTDGDHRADVRTTLYTGFALANVEGRLSNPRLGLDNWFYVVNHGYPGEISSPQRPEMPTVNVRDREFRFHPLRGLAAASTGDAQFGHDYNEWGHWFIAHNTVHLRHTVIPPGYLARNPLLPVEHTEEDISDHGRPASTVFPISQPQQWRIDRTTVRRERYAQTRPGREEQLEGFFTAACGTTVYSGDKFPDRFRGSVFVGEGNGNLVHCDLLTPRGPTYVASRWPPTTAFLASTDNWFRPVNFTNAPDGNLYVIDYYRQYLEHPISIPEAVKRRLKMDFRAGEDLGRIYRVVAEGFDSSDRKPALGSVPSADLVRHLEHPNGWHRRTAQRLLLERQDGAVSGDLRTIALSHPEPTVQLRALWALEGLDALDADTVSSALEDAHPAIRESALRLAEGFPNTFFAQILAATWDENPRVAFQATLSAGGLRQQHSVATALAGVLARFPDERWFHTAALSAPPRMAVPVLAALVKDHPGFFGTRTSPRARYLQSVAQVAGAQSDSALTDSLLRLLSHAEPLSHARWKIAALNGLGEGLSLHIGQPGRKSIAGEAVSQFLEDPSDDVRTAASKIAHYFDLASHVQRAKNLAQAPESPVSERLAAARVLQAGRYADVAASLVRFLVHHPEPDLRAQAARSLAMFDDPRAAQTLIAAWPDSSPSIRNTMADVLIRKHRHAMALVEAIRDGQIQATEVPAITRIRLAQHPNDQVREAAQGLESAGARDRDQVIADQLVALDLSADPQRGDEVFRRECANCHLSRALRGRIGPDLSGVANRSKEDLLTSILDPSYAIDDRYRNQLLETSDGRFYDGILVSETSATITLRGETKDISVLKSDIAELRESDVSLMPEGLEESLTQQDMADVIAFLQAGL